MNRLCLTLSRVLGTALLWAGGCNQPTMVTDQTYVSGLRILAIKAEPPEAASGQTVTLTVLAVDTLSRSIELSWAYCVATPPQGQLVNSDCVTNSTASYIYPIGSGLTSTLVMPMVDAATLGSADGTGGVYLPVVANATAGSDSVIADYRLRVGMGSTPNNNPVLSGISQVTADAGGADTLTALDPATPLVVHSGDKLTLRAQFMTGSAESYTSSGSGADGGMGQSGMATETLSVSWFSTAGSLGGAGGGPPTPTMPGAPLPDGVLTLDTNLPASGGTIDLWAVGRDNRGGTDYLHRTLSFQ